MDVAIQILAAYLINSKSLKTHSTHQLDQLGTNFVPKPQSIALASAMDRFDTSKDPRFKRAPRHVRRVQVDGRFARMFKDQQFVETPKVDARGQPLRKDAGKQKLQEFYELAGVEGAENMVSSAAADGDEDEDLEGLEGLEEEELEDLDESEEEDWVMMDHKPLADACI